MLGQQGPTRPDNRSATGQRQRGENGRGRFSTRHIVNSLTIDTAKTLVHSFISCRLDYCNSLLFGISNEQLQRLQSVQNAAARLVTGTRRFDHITPVLVGLHWLPVRYRVSYKLATVVYKCLHGQAPPYLAADCFGHRSANCPQISRLYNTGHSQNSHQAWRQSIFCCRPSYMEQFTCLY